MPPMATKGSGQLPIHVVEVAETDRGADVLLGGGGEDRADADVISPDSNCRLGLGRAVGRQTDDHAGPDQPANLRHRQVVLADMDPIGIDQHRQVDMIVDDEGDAGLAGQFADLQAFRQHRGPALVGRLLPVLQDGDAACNHRLRHLDVGAAAGKFLGGDAVDAGRQGGVSLWSDMGASRRCRRISVMRQATASTLWA